MADAQLNIAIDADLKAFFLSFCEERGSKAKDCGAAALMLFMGLDANRREALIKRHRLLMKGELTLAAVVDDPYGDNTATRRTISTGEPDVTPAPKIAKSKR